MTRALYNIKLTVTLQAPYLVHGNDPGRHGLDATLLLNHRKIPILPGTLLQGRIAECWKTLGKQLGDASPEKWGACHEKWFGKPGNDPERARLRVQDLVLTKVNDTDYTSESAPPEHDTVRIALDDERGAVKSNALLIIEQLCPVGAVLEFSGDWQVWAETDEITLLKSQIHAALLLQTQLGAYRGVGFGRLKSVMVKEPEPVQNKPEPVQNKSLAISLASRQRLALSFAEPICVNAKSRRGNVFESGNVIPGGAILGALADMLKVKHGKKKLDEIANDPAIPNSADLSLKADAILARHFDHLRCTHALPSLHGCKRPVPLPQSLVMYDKKLLDAFYHSGPPDKLMEAPKFQTDWKDDDFTMAEVYQGWPQLPRHLRLRTAIEAGQAKKAPKRSEQGNVPDEVLNDRSVYTPDGEPWDKGSLFAYDCVHAARDKRGNMSNWQFDLSLPRPAVDSSGTVIPISGEDREAINTALTNLLAQGLAPIGKTAARAEVELLTGTQANSQWPSRAGWKKDQPWKIGDKVPVLLVTDTLLFTTNALLPDEQGQTDQQGKPQFSLAGTPLKTLKEIYADCFNQLALSVLNAPLDTLAESNPAIHLSHFFATQKLQGGDYLNKRFGKKDQAYQPKVLTEAGSVFVFTIIDAAKAQTVFEHWRENGLALPEAVKDAYGYAWKSHPYLPQNGYGEVAIAPDHGFEELLPL